MVKDIDTYLINGKLIDGTGSKIKENVCIGIKNRKISLIEDEVNENVIDDKCTVINLRGATILPGFINAHAHTGFKYLKGELCSRFQEEYLKVFKSLYKRRDNDYS